MSATNETPEAAEFVRQRIEQDETTVADYFEKRLREEASRYSAHPDYRPEWAPEEVDR